MAVIPGVLSTGLLQPHLEKYFLAQNGYRATYNFLRIFSTVHWVAGITIIVLHAEFSSAQTLLAIPHVWEAMGTGGTLTFLGYRYWQLANWVAYTAQLSSENDERIVA